MVNDDHDKEKFMAEDVKMKAKQELTSASKTPTNEPNATAAPDALDELFFESSVDRGELEVIPEGEDEGGEDAMDVDADGSEGNPSNTVHNAGYLS